MYGVFARNVSLIALANALLGLRSLFFIPIIVKGLGEGAYGVWTQVVVFVLLASSLATLGLKNAVSRFLSGKDTLQELREGYYSCLFVSAGLSVVAVLLARGILAAVVGQEVPSFQIITVGLWLIPPESVSIILFSYFAARRKMRTYAFVTNLKAYGEVALVYWFVGSGRGILGAIQGAMIARVCMALLLTFLIVREIGFRAPKFVHVREYLAYSVPTLAASMAAWVLAFSDRYIIRLFMDDIAVGIYSAAYSLGHSVNFLLLPLTTVLNPTIFRLWERGDRERAVELQTRSLKFFLLLAVPASVGVSCLATEILEILATSDTARIGAIIVPIIALSILIQGTAMITGRVFPLHKDTKTSGSIWGVSALVNVVLNFLLVPYYGLLGAAVATLVSCCVALALIQIIGSKYLAHRPKFPGMFLGKSLVSCSMMIVSILSLSSLLEPGPNSVIVKALVGCCVYLAVIWAIRGLSSEEVEFMLRVVRRPTEGGESEVPERHPLEDQ